MSNYDKVMKLLMEAFEESSSSVEDKGEIPVGISNHHIHLSQEDLNSLFGQGYELTKLKDLSQPGQYACKETLTICGPKGAIEKVRILGPVRNKTQVEVLKGDSFKLGVKPEVRMSGDLNGTAGITLIGPKGSIQLLEGLIIAQRHIHMNSKDGEILGVEDGDIVNIEVCGLRGGVYNNVAIRSNNNSALECHIDIEEANAMDINSKTKIKIIK